jgi:hypothetical protein
VKALSALADGRMKILFGANWPAWLAPWGTKGERVDHAFEAGPSTGCRLILILHLLCSPRISARPIKMISGLAESPKKYVSCVTWS